MNTPNYSALLQSFWTPPRTPITENSNSNNHPTEPTDIAEFLGEDLLWQQTISALKPTKHIIYHGLEVNQGLCKT
jgi:DEAD/DEAH box helicase domain-containing protein